MKLIYTVCTGNYLYQALTMGESLNKTNPDYELVIGLVAGGNPLSKSNPDYELISGLINEKPTLSIEATHQIIPISEVQPVNLAGFKGDYTVMEVATACKPVFGLYLFEKYPE